MSITGVGTTSLRKSDLLNQKIPSAGFKKTVFAHKASAGATQINLASLTTPTELSTNGFSQPSGAELQNANLLTFRNNLKLVSSLRGQLVDFFSYTVSSSTVITFLGFTALEGEVFVGTIDYNAVSSNVPVDVSPIVATGTLTASTTDFNVGTAFTTNKFSTSQVGAVIVFLDGQQMFRNTGNSSVTLDADYYEVDNGSGSSTVIRFNASVAYDRNVLVISNGMVFSQPDGSVRSSLEVVQGQVNNMANYVGALAGQPITTVLGGSPANTDLKAFGDRVLTMEGNRARIDASNTWTVAQPLVGRTDGAAVPAGQIGEVLSQSRLRSVGVSLTTATTANVTSTALTLGAGVWEISGFVNFSSGGSTSSTGLFAAISTTSATLPGADTYSVQDANGQIQNLMGGYALNNTDLSLHTGTSRVSLSGPTVFYLVARANFSASTITANGTIRAVRIA